MAERLYAFAWLSWPLMSGFISQHISGRDLMYSICGYPLATASLVYSTPVGSPWAVCLFIYFEVSDLTSHNDFVSVLSYGPHWVKTHRRE